MAWTLRQPSPGRTILPIMYFSTLSILALAPLAEAAQGVVEVGNPHVSGERVRLANESRQAMCR
jgi:hypothetical protein